MKRNRGIWLTISCILVIGIAVTCMTSYMIRKQEQDQSWEELSAGAYDQPLEAPSIGYEETAAGAAADGKSGRGAMSPAAAGAEGEASAAMARAGLAAGATGATGAAGPAAGGAVPEGEAAQGARQLAQEEVMAETAAAQAVPEAAVLSAGDQQESVDAGPGGAPVLVEITPLDKGVSLAPDSSAVEMRGYYTERLAQLDAQIQQMRDEATDTTAYTMKSTADKELKLWDAELNAVYTTIISCLDEEGKAALTQEQQQWMKDRDTKAAEAAKKSGGGTMEGVEYTASLAESTRQRNYDLVNRYLDVLEGDLAS